MSVSMIYFIGNIVRIGLFGCIIHGINNFVKNKNELLEWECRIKELQNEKDNNNI